MKKAQDELAVTDKEIKTLKPQLQLETLHERSKNKENTILILNTKLL